MRNKKTSEENPSRMMKQIWDKKVDQQSRRHTTEDERNSHIMFVASYNGSMASNSADHLGFVRYSELLLVNTKRQSSIQSSDYSYSM